MNDHRYCVVMCGGVGSRFWPVSRMEMPKQFLDFFGTGRTMLQLTVERIGSLIPKDNIILATNRDYADIVREQLPDIKESNILLEPARRNTAPCICWAAHHIYALDPDASIITLPSDHLILREKEFLKVLEEGLAFIEKADRLLAIGLKPTSPHTAYGYIQQGAPVDGQRGFCKVKSFTEKPNLEMAKVFVDSGEFFWNSGMFLWRADSILKAFSRCAADTAAIFDAGDSVYGTPKETEFIEHAFPEAQSISIDYAIMEKADNVFVKTADLGWSDLGSWKALYEVSPHGPSGNVTQNCKVMANNCRNTIFSVPDDKIVVAEGLEGYVVAEKDNALLIYPIEEEHKIRAVVNDVRARFGESYV